MKNLAGITQLLALALVVLLATGCQDTAAPTPTPSSSAGGGTIRTGRGMVAQTTLEEVAMK